MIYSIIYQELEGTTSKNVPKTEMDVVGQTSTEPSVPSGTELPINNIPRKSVSDSVQVVTDNDVPQQPKKVSTDGSDDDNYSSDDDEDEETSGKIVTKAGIEVK